jgi:hypothetical protein
VSADQAGTYTFTFYHNCPPGPGCQDLIQGQVEVGEDDVLTFDPPNPEVGETFRVAVRSNTPYVYVELGVDEPSHVAGSWPRGPNSVDSSGPYRWIWEGVSADQAGTYTFTFYYNCPPGPGCQVVVQGVVEIGSAQPADVDGDGIPDNVEGTGDPDADGIPNYQDTDSDGDGVPDSVEGTADSDGDGVPDREEHNGRDTDGDGDPDSQDTDSDDDGTLDGEEGTGDSDGDGIPDRLDAGSGAGGGDSDGDGISDAEETSDGVFADADGDGIPNYMDTDSDGDGLLDVDEGAGDSDGDGTPDYLDPILRLYLPLVTRNYTTFHTLSDAPDACPGQTVLIGHSYRDDADGENDVDWYAFEAVAGQAYTLRTSDLESRSDTVMALYDRGCTILLAINDDAGYPDISSRIVWTAEYDGAYHVQVRNYDWRVYGPNTGYTFRIIEGVVLGSAGEASGRGAKPVPPPPVSPEPVEGPIGQLDDAELSR